MRTDIPMGLGHNHRAEHGRDRSWGQPAYHDWNREEPLLKPKGGLDLGLRPVPYLTTGFRCARCPASSGYQVSPSMVRFRKWGYE